MAFLFLTLEEVLTLHEQNIDEFGGSPGLRDEGALGAALVAAENHVHYEAAGIVACASTYAYHLSQAHAFIDGNKRIAAAATELFIRLNGFRLIMSNTEVVALFLDIAAGHMTRNEIEEVLEPRIARAE